MTLPLELGQPRERLGQAEEPVGHVEPVLGLLPSTRDVERPGRADARLAGLDEFRQGDVNDALAAGLGAADAEQAVDLLGQALTGRAGELVPEAMPVTSRLTASGPVVSASLRIFAGRCGPDCLMSCRQQRVMPRTAVDGTGPVRTVSARPQASGALRIPL